MQPNIMLPVQATPVAGRAASSSLGEAAQAVEGGDFAAQLKQVGQQFGGQGDASTGANAQPVKGLVEFLTSTDGELLPFDEAVAADVAATTETVSPETVPEQAVTALPVTAETAQSVRVALGDVATEQGKGLPPGGSPLPQHAQIAGAAEVPLTDANAPEVTRPGQGAVAGAEPGERPLPASDRARFEITQNADAVRQPVEVTPSVKPEVTLMEGNRQAPLLEQSASFQVVAAGASTPATGAVDGARPGAMTEPGAMRPQISMDTPLGKEGWAQEMGTRLRVMVERGNQTAEIRLNPPELGSMEVKITNDGERTNVTFFAQNGATRDALEAAMPRLREMFGDSGLQLADANVSQQQTMAQEQERDGEGSTFGADGEPVDGADGETGGNSTAVASSSSSLVDYYI